MANGSIILNGGKQIMIERAYNSSTTTTVPSQFQVGINNGTPNVGDTALNTAIPIDDGTVNDDGSNTFTGSNGGDNSTNNTTIFKPGAGVSDDTAQSLITNATSATKTWTIANLASAGTNINGAQPFGLWFYIADATTLAFFLTSGTALEIRLGSDTSNYYSYTRTAAQLSTGWNWITSGATTAVNTLTETGTVSGNIDTFVIIVTTNNSTDDWTDGNVVYDLLRQWDPATDLVKNFESGYPTIDTSNFEAEYRCVLSSTEANGFDINGFMPFNTDSTILAHSEDTFTAESKSDTDVFTFIVKDKIE